FFEDGVALDGVRSRIVGVGGQRRLFTRWGGRRRRFGRQDWVAEDAGAEWLILFVAGGAALGRVHEAGFVVGCGRFRAWCGRRSFRPGLGSAFALLVTATAASARIGPATAPSPAPTRVIAFFRRSFGRLFGGSRFRHLL